MRINRTNAMTERPDTLFGMKPKGKMSAMKLTNKEVTRTGEYYYIII